MENDDTVLTYAWNGKGR